jgi:putative ABC transport system permease protein
MADRKIQILHIIQILLISLLSFILSLALFKAIQPLLNYYFTKNNLPFVLTVQFSTLMFSFALSVVSPLMMFMPINISISQLNPKDLFLNQARNIKSHTGIYLWYVFCIVSFWGLSFYQSKSYKIASLFTFGIILIVFILKMLLSALFLFIRKNIANMSLDWTVVYAIRSVINKKKIADIVFITFTMAVLILTLLPHIKQSIISEITPQQKSSLPRLFMFDVQSGQKAELENLAKKYFDSKLDFIPLVRSRILKINNNDYDRIDKNANLTTREEDEEIRFRNRGVNLTYAQQLKESETLTEGTWNPEKFTGTGLPEVSLEEKYATRVGAQINDEMTFDVQGLEIKARVTSLRKVRWTSFNPNFFILFQSGVLEEAPQNFLTSLSTTKDYLEFQNAVVTQLPNISIIDVKQTVEGILVFVEQMSLALQLMAVISIILGLFIFIVLIKTQINERINEFNLLKTLGTDTQTIQKIILIQFLFILSLSLIIGISMGMVLTHILVTTVFNISTQFDLISVSLVVLILLPLAYGIIYQATRFLNRLSPLSLIRS